jgi:hypothetical protein
MRKRTGHTQFVSQYRLKSSDLTELATALVPLLVIKIRRQKRAKTLRVILGMENLMCIEKNEGCRRKEGRNKSFGHWRGTLKSLPIRHKRG